MTANVEVSDPVIDDNYDDFSDEVVLEDHTDSDFFEDVLVDDQDDDLEDNQEVIDLLTNIYNSVSGNSIVEDSLDVDSLDFFDYGIEPFSDYSGTYGTISSDYYNYFSGFLSKLLPTEHYVCSRYWLSNNTSNYLFAWGESLDFSGSYFFGSDINVVTISGSGSSLVYSYDVQSSFSLSPGNGLVYTDLSSKYPALSSPSDTSLRQIVLFFGISLVFYTVTKFFVFKKRTKVGKYL